MIKKIKKPDERRREIIAVSRKLFLEKGFEKSTIQDVMYHLNIAKGTTYHYFKSKRQLLDAVIYDMVDEYLMAVKRATNKHHKNAIEKLSALIKAGVANGKLAKMLDSLHRPENSEMHTRLLAVTITKLAPLYVQVIEQGCKEGVFQIEHPLECAEMLLAGIQFITDQGIYSWEKEDIIRRNCAIPEFIESMLHAPKNSFLKALKNKDTK
jgi:AcrR family transcriptional regulator